MKRGTIGRIRRGLRRGESGQAFTELAVSLVAILAAFVGFLLVASLGSDGVSSIIMARENADKSRNSYSPLQGGSSIRDWNRGEDGILFTQDDNPIYGGYGDGADFKDQLSDNTGLVKLQNPPSASRLDGEFARLQDSNFFVNAAALSHGEGPHISEDKTFSKHKISELKDAFRWLFNLNGTYIHDTVYMPAHIDN